MSRNARKTAPGNTKPAGPAGTAVKAAAGSATADAFVAHRLFQEENAMEFNTFYQYFLYTKNWAYIMMFVVLPLYVLYWNFVLNPGKKKRNNSARH